MLEKLTPEKFIEARLKKAIEKRGGMCLKLVSPTMAGLPDRIILAAGGKVVFVEVKAPGRKPRPLQAYVHRKLEALGFKVFVVDDLRQIEEVCNAIQAP